MQATVWIKYLFGQADSIDRVARSRAALWTGIALVLLTSIARNYDQTHISEQPFLWILGPLLFSFVSGSWLYLVVYVVCARREMSAPGDPGPAVDGGWLAFMGLFWMTAPVAWLYAIPVERFMDSVSAAHANVTLLSLVSLWRVLLMTRVLQVTTKAPFLIALVWVLFAASMEVLVVFFFGGGLAKSVMASMGGMRNSPEEQILLRAMGTAFNAALWLAPLSSLVALKWQPKQLLQPLTIPVAGPVPWSGLAVATCFWIAIAVVPQRELANTVAVERLLTGSQARAAIDFMAAQQPGDFAPARALPPKPFERSIFTELPACFGAVKPSDPAWIRSVLMSKLDIMLSHLKPRWRREGTAATQPRADQIEYILHSLMRNGPDGDALLKLLEGLQRLPEGRAWLETNSVFTEALWKSADEAQWRFGGGPQTRSNQETSWQALSNHLSSHFLTNGMLLVTNKAGVLPTPARP
jgi:hypothetical protein